MHGLSCCSCFSSCFWSFTSAAPVISFPFSFPSSSLSAMSAQLIFFFMLLIFLSIFPVIGVVVGGFATIVAHVLVLNVVTSGGGSGVDVRTTNESLFHLFDWRL